MDLAESYSPEEPKPLGGYTILLLVFNGSVALFGALLASSRRRLPERVPAGDMALMSVATFKLSRLITKDKVTAVMRAPFTQYEGSGGPSEVSEHPRSSTGLRGAVGELLTCPYCIEQWIATSLFAVFVWQPRLARSVSSVFTVVTGADLLQQAWVAIDKAA